MAMAWWQTPQMKASFSARPRAEVAWHGIACTSPFQSKPSSHPQPPPPSKQAVQPPTSPPPTMGPLSPAASHHNHTAADHSHSTPGPTPRQPSLKNGPQLVGGGAEQRGKGDVGRGQRQQHAKGGVEGEGLVVDQQEVEELPCGGLEPHLQGEGSVCVHMRGALVCACAWTHPFSCPAPLAGHSPASSTQSPPSTPRAPPPSPPPNITPPNYTPQRTSQ